MPRKPKEYPYQDLVFLASISHRHRRAAAGGTAERASYYCAELRYEYSGTVLVHRYAQKDDLDSLDNYMQEYIFPEMYYEAARLRKENGDNESQYLRIGLFWEMFKDDIAARYHWNSSATIDDKKRKLIRVLPHLFDKSMKDLTFEDYQNAINQTAKETNNNNTKTKLEYYVLLSKLTNTAFMRGICSNDPLEDYVKLFRRTRDPISDIRNRFKTNHLSDTKQRDLYQTICDKIESEGKYFGLALMLFAGLSIEESCALRKSDFCELQIFPGIKCISVQKACREIKENGETKLDDSDLMDRVNAYRLIPLHPCLRMLFEAKASVSEAALKEKTRDFYLVTNGKNISLQVPPSELKAFCRRVLEDHAIRNKVTITQLPKVSSRTFYFVPTSILRDNYIYQLRARGMTESEIHYLCGTGLPTTASLHYRDWASDYTQLTLYKKTCRWRIDDTHTRHYTDTAIAEIPANVTEALEEMLPCQPVTARITISSAGNEPFSAPCNVKIRINASGGFFGQCTIVSNTDDEDDVDDEAIDIDIDSSDTNGVEVRNEDADDSAAGEIHYYEHDVEDAGNEGKNSLERDGA